MIGVICWPAEVSRAVPMGTAFRYQGDLWHLGSPASGLYEFEFRLYDYPNAGAQVGSTIQVNDVNVAEGYFAVELDFGSGVFDGDGRWLDISVRPGDFNDPCEYTVLSPRTELTPVPYALQTHGIFVDDVRYIDYPDTWTAKEWTRPKTSEVF